MCKTNPILFLIFLSIIGNAFSRAGMEPLFNTSMCAPIHFPPLISSFVLLNLIERKKKKKKREREREERRQTCALIYLSSLAMLATAHVREKENVMVLFIVTVAVKKKAFLYLIAPISAHPSSL